MPPPPQEAPCGSTGCLLEVCLEAQSNSFWIDVRRPGANASLFNTAYGPSEDWGGGGGKVRAEGGC